MVERTPAEESSDTAQNGTYNEEEDDDMTTGPQPLSLLEVRSIILLDSYLCEGKRHYST